MFSFGGGYSLGLHAAMPAWNLKKNEHAGWEVRFFFFLRGSSRNWWVLEKRGQKHVSLAASRTRDHTEPRLTFFFVFFLKKHVFFSISLVWFPPLHSLHQLWGFFFLWWYEEAAYLNRIFFLCLKRTLSPHWSSFLCLFFASALLLFFFTCFFLGFCDSTDYFERGK